MYFIGDTLMSPAGGHNKLYKGKGKGRPITGNEGTDKGVEA
jgi:hypothetical protein